MKITICFLVLISFTISCRNNPNLKKEQVISELTTEKTTDEPAEAAVELPDYYISPASAEFEPMRMHSGSFQRFDMLQVLKNEQPIKLSDLGKEVVYHRITEPLINIRNIFPVPGGFMVSAYAGSVYIFDKEFKAGKKVIQDDIDIKKIRGDYWTTFKNVIIDLCYDNNSGYVFCQIYKIIAEKPEHSTGIVHINDLKDSSQPITPDDLKNRIKSSSQMEMLPVRNGYATMKRNGTTLYTFNVKGDTMCIYSPVDETSLPNRTIRMAELSTRYVYRNHSYFRPAYTNRIFQITDLNTFTDIYYIDFGDKQVSPEEGPNTSVSLSDKLLLDDWCETDDYILMRFTQNYDCPNNRDNGSVKFHQAIYDKKTKEFYSFTNHKKLSQPYNIPNDIDNGIDFWPNKTIDGRPYMTLSGEKYKEMLKSKPDHMPAFPDITDEEVVLITIN